VKLKLLVGQEYELEHKLHGGDRRSKTFEEKSKAQNEPLKSTAEKIAEEHGVSPRPYLMATVRRIDLSSSRNSIKRLI